MGSFKQHVTCSTITGIVVGTGAYQAGFSLPTSLLSGGLCSMAGMLPDIDSDSSRSFQECIYLAAALGGVLLMERLRHFGVDKDIVILSGASMFLFVRFVVGEMIKKITAHRGMFHSIPAAVLSGQIVFFLSTGTATERVFKGFALFAGYMSHLILDEFCSIDSTGRSLRLKKSFGTALKFYDSKRTPVALALYALIGFLGVTAIKNPNWIEELDGDGAAVQTARNQDVDSSSGRFFGLLAAVENSAAKALHPEQAAANPKAQAGDVHREASEYLARAEQGLPAPVAANPVASNSIAIPVTNSVAPPSSPSPVAPHQELRPLGNPGVASNTGFYSDHHLFSQIPDTPGPAPSVLKTAGIGIPSETPVPVTTPSNYMPPVAAPTTYRLSGNDFTPRGTWHLPSGRSAAPATLALP